MASRRFTLSEQRFPATPEFTAVARRWNEHGIDILFGLVWSGYDLLWAEVLCDADWTQVTDDVERDLNEHLELRIRRSMTGYEPFDVQHGRYERETRLPPPAQPPQYDLAFFLRESPRVSLPLEAKILHTDQDLGPYLNDVKGEFLKCRYAPFSAEGAMLGYLLKGNSTRVFAKIERDLPCALRLHNGFPQRPHRFSEHTRMVEPGKRYPVAFRCHHLVLSLTSQSGRSSRTFK